MKEALYQITLYGEDQFIRNLEHDAQGQYFDLEGEKFYVPDMVHPEIKSIEKACYTCLSTDMVDDLYCVRHK